MSWTELDGSAILVEGEKYKLTTYYERTEGNSPDSDVAAALEIGLSNAELEDKIYQDTHARIKVLNRFSSVVKPGQEYSYTVIVTPTNLRGNPLPLAVIIPAVALAMKIGLWASIAAVVYMITDAFKVTQSKAYEEGGIVGGLTNQAMYLAVAAVVVIFLLKR